MHTVPGVNCIVNQNPEEWVTEARSFVGRWVLRAFLGCLMSSAGYHLGARWEASGIVRDPPFFEPPICLDLGAADILVRKSQRREVLVMSVVRSSSRC